MAASTFLLGGELRVNRMGYGAMRLTGQPGNFGPYPNWDEGKLLLRHAVELGVNHIDTAYAYGPGFSEQIIAEALHPYPEDLVIATKGGVEKPEPGTVIPDGRPENLRRHLEESLKRLRIDTVQLYYLHLPDPSVPLADSVGELARQREQGKIRFVALSNVSLSELEEALKIVPIAAVQNRYNAKETKWDAVVDFTNEKGIAFVPWGPLGAEPFSDEAPLSSGPLQDGRTAPQRALRTLLERSPNILPIPGTTKLAHLEENLRAG